MGSIFFPGFRPDGGRELWATDGSEEGTRRIADLNPTGSSSPGSLTV